MWLNDAFMLRMGATSKQAAIRATNATINSNLTLQRNVCVCAYVCARTGGCASLCAPRLPAPHEVPAAQVAYARAVLPITA